MIAGRMERSGTLRESRSNNLTGNWRNARLEGKSGR